MSPSLEILARRSPRIAVVLEAISGRSDVLELRARIVLYLLAVRCPHRGRPRRDWYIPGAAARLGPTGIRRAWAQHWGDEPPTLRTIRAHLSALERAFVIVRSPGDWIAGTRDPDHPERRPRYPDTIHILEGEAAASWWSRLMRTAGDRVRWARRSVDRWDAFLGRDWRARAAAEPLLPFEAAARPARAQAAPDPATTPALPARLRELARRRESSALILAELAAAGVRIRGRVTFRLMARLERLRGACALLARALDRGDRIRSLSAWIVQAALRAPPRELALALQTGIRR